MTKSKFTIQSSLRLQGLRPASSQVLGSVRMMPLLRDEVPGDLRIASRRYGAGCTVVNLDGIHNPREQAAGTGPNKYCASYVPHGLVVHWADDGAPVASLRTDLDDGKPLRAREVKKGSGGPFDVQVLHRMVKREGDNSLRLLPLHLAMEGFLLLHFGGPDIAWKGYTSQGLEERWEWTMGGRAIADLEDALRVFEIHDRQCGVLLFVADALASAFVVSHPDDYRLLHRSVIEDFFCRLICEYGRLYRNTQPFELRLDAAKVRSLEDLRKVYLSSRAEVDQFTVDMASGIIGRSIQAQSIYTAGPFELQRFITDLQPEAENHIGEAMIREDGTLEYLKSYRLSKQQTRRAYLLQILAGNQWNLPAAAYSQRQSPREFLLRLIASGFSYLFTPEFIRETLKEGKPEGRDIKKGR